MKIRTNLSAQDLQAISKGLSKAAKIGHKGLSLENPAEHRVMSLVDNAFNDYIESLEEHFYKVLVEEQEI